VFRGASVDTSVIVLTKRKLPAPAHTVQIFRSSNPETAELVGSQLQQAWSEHPEQHFGISGGNASDVLLSKMKAASFPLGEIATAYFGIQTHGRSKYVAKQAVSDSFRPIVDGSNISRYSLTRSSEFVDFRPEAVKSGGKAAVHEQERIGVRQIGEVPVATLLPAGIYALNTIYNIYFIRNTGYSLNFMLGVLLSRALGWYWRSIFFDQKRTFPKVKKEALLAIPVPKIDFSSASNRARHDHMVALVERMLALHKQQAATTTGHDKTLIGRQIDATDRQIDRLVYELYGLTEEEIGIVEGTASERSNDTTGGHP
jgi:type IV secretory pathway protease TraF